MKVQLFDVFKAEGEPFEVALYTEIISEYILRREEQTGITAKTPEQRDTMVPSDEQSVIDMINEALNEFEKNGGIDMINEALDVFKKNGGLQDET